MLYKQHPMKAPDDESALARRDALIAELQALPNLLRGSLTQLRVRCGAPGCVCARGAGHLKTHCQVRVRGGYRTLYVNEERREEIEGLVASYRRLKEIIEELTEANLELLRSSAAAPRAKVARRKPSNAK